MRHKLVRWLAVAVVMCIAPVLAVDRSKFRTCEQTQFCHKHRFDVAGHGDFHVIPSSVALNGHTLHFDLQQGATSSGIATELLQGTLEFVLNESSSSVPAIRLHVSEKYEDPNDPKKRWENPDVLQPDALATRALTQVSVEESGLSNIDGETTVLLKPLQSSADVTVAFRLAPFGVDVYLNKALVISTNTNHQMHFERRRERTTSSDSPSATSDAPAVEDVHGGKTVVDYGEDGLAIYSDGTVQEKAQVVEPSSSPPSSSLSEEGWEESFGGHTDKKKYGPSSLGLDISFHGSTRRPLYGIPEHATDFLLKDTMVSSTNEAISDPYRLYNLDVFEYDLDVPMTLYGSIPVLISPSKDTTVGMFWHNPSETFVDIETTTDRTTSHWMSESGVLDLFLILGPTPLEWFQQYTRVTGRASLPPLFAIGYHQCRWNYKNELDVDRVDAGFDQHLIPYDVLWLDIEHTDGKRYFTWDAHAFPTPREMQERVARTGRKMVTIVDPHIKVDTNYRIHQQAIADNVYIKEEDGVTDFRGWCWPGDSSYVDFTSSRARRWWSLRFNYDQYIGSTEELYTWNDMNEPSVFNGPEVSMRKTCLNGQGIEHREWHNLYGYYMHQATMEGQLVRQVPSMTETTEEIPITKDMLRPFVLSRAFFAGTQRFGAIWTGDNKAEWGHLAYATKMLLSMSVTGLTFVGADVGGFFGNPDTELLTRWYQAAVYQPFFRGHAHHDSNRREPWVFGEPHTARLRASIRERYSILPYLYTLFHTCFQSGTPVMRPLWMHFPSEAQSFTNEDQFLLGPDLLIKPITTPGTVETQVFLPSLEEETTVWYHITNHYKRYTAGTINHVPAPIDYSPVFQRGGAVIPRKNRVRRSSSLMVNDPYTLVVTLDTTLQAQGSLYLDDGETFAYSEHLDRAYTILQYKVTRTGMQATVISNQFESRAWLERIEIYGFQQQAPKHVTLNGATVLEATYDRNKDQFVIRKPNVSATVAWTIEWEDK